jgi:hypothetical protein
MLVFRVCLLAILLGWADTATTRHANVSRGFFLQIQNATEKDIAAMEVAMSDRVVAFSHAASVRMSKLSKHFDFSWRNNLVIIPCLAVGGPLYYIWNKLEPTGKADDIFTAIDADLREVEIARVGASGVALLRRQCDRHTGIMFAFTGIMLQTIFLYFVFASCFQRIAHEWEPHSHADTTPIALIFCSLFCNTLVCCSSLILGRKCWSTKAPEGYQQIHEALVCLDSFAIPSVCMFVGALYLCTSDGISSLVFSSTSMAFICSINSQIAGLMSWSLSGHGGRAFQPANVSIKDSENSTEYAHYSFILSGIVALVTLPIAWLLGII